MDVTKGFKSARLADKRVWYYTNAGPVFYITKTEGWFSGVYDTGEYDVNNLSEHSFFGGGIGASTHPLIMQGFRSLYPGFKSDVGTSMVNGTNCKLDITSGFRIKGEPVTNCVIWEADGYVHTEPEEDNPEINKKYKVKIYTAVAFTTG